MPRLFIIFGFLDLVYCHVYLLIKRPMYDHCTYWIWTVFIVSTLHHRTFTYLHGRDVPLNRLIAGIGQYVFLMRRLRVWSYIVRQATSFLFLAAVIDVFLFCWWKLAGVFRIRGCIRWLRMRDVAASHNLVALLRVVPSTELLLTEGARGEERGLFLEWRLLDRHEAAWLLLMLLFDRFPLGIVQTWRALLLLLILFVIVDLLEELGQAALVRFVNCRAWSVACL